MNRARPVGLSAVPPLLLALCTLGCAGSGLRAPASRTSPPPSRAGEEVDSPGVSLPGEGPIGLEDLLRVADRHSPRIAAARAAVREAEGRAWQAGLWPDPTLELEIEGMPADQPGTARSENTVRVAQPVAVGGRLAAARRAGRAAADALHEGLARVRRSVRARVTGAHLEIVALRRGLGWHETLLEDARQTLDLARARAEAGAAPASFRDLAELAVDELEVAGERLRQDLVEARSRLSTALGGRPVDEARLSSPSSRILPSPDLPVDDVASEHPTVRSAELEVEAARRRVDRARAERIPDPTLFFSYGRNEAVERDVLGAGVSLPVPVFDRNQGAVREAVAALRGAEATLAARRAEIRSEAAAARTALASALQRATAHEDRIVPRAVEARDRARDAYRAGHLGFLELLGAQEALVKTRLAHLRELRDLAVARARVVRLVGPSIDPSPPTGRSP